MIANVPDALVVIDEQAATIADLRQQLADQQRDFNAKMLSVCDELATVKGERDAWKEQFEASADPDGDYREYCSNIMYDLQLERDEAKTTIEDRETELVQLTHDWVRAVALAKQLRGERAKLRNALRLIGAFEHSSIHIDSELPYAHDDMIDLAREVLDDD